MPIPSSMSADSFIQSSMWVWVWVWSQLTDRLVGQCSTVSYVSLSSRESNATATPSLNICRACITVLRSQRAHVITKSDLCARPSKVLAVVVAMYPDNLGWTSPGYVGNVDAMVRNGATPANLLPQYSSGVAIAPCGLPERHRQWPWCTGFRFETCRSPSWRLDGG